MAAIISSTASGGGGGRPALDDLHETRDGGRRLRALADPAVRPLGVGLPLAVMGVTVVWTLGLYRAAREAEARLKAAGAL